MINDRATQALSALGYTDFKLYLGNGKNLKVVDGRSFDLIIANTVIQHLPTKVLKAYFKDIRNLLTHDGIAVLQVLETRSTQSKKRLSSTDLFSVAYTKKEFLKLVLQSNLIIDKFSDLEYGQGETYWSIYVLRSN